MRVLGRSTGAAIDSNALKAEHRWQAVLGYPAYREAIWKLNSGFDGVAVLRLKCDPCQLFANNLNRAA
jgi:hypothetical protein